MRKLIPYLTVLVTFSSVGCGVLTSSSATSLDESDPELDRIYAELVGRGGLLNPYSDSEISGAIAPLASTGTPSGLADATISFGGVKFFGIKSLVSRSLSTINSSINARPSVGDYLKHHKISKDDLTIRSKAELRSSLEAVKLAMDIVAHAGNNDLALDRSEKDLLTKTTNADGQTVGWLQPCEQNSAKGRQAFCDPEKSPGQDAFSPYVVNQVVQDTDESCTGQAKKQLACLRDAQAAYERSTKWDSATGTEGIVPLVPEWIEDQHKRCVRGVGFLFGTSSGASGSCAGVTASCIQQKNAVLRAACEQSKRAMYDRKSKTFSVIQKTKS